VYRAIAKAPAAAGAVQATAGAKRQVSPMGILRLDGRSRRAAFQYRTSLQRHLAISGVPAIYPS